YQREVQKVRQVLGERWTGVEGADGRIIALHDRLLGSLSRVNACAMGLNLQVNLNRIKYDQAQGPSQEDSSLAAIEQASSSETPPNQGPTSTLSSDRVADGLVVAMRVNTPPAVMPSASASPSRMLRETVLLPPKGGQRTSCEATYKQIAKNLEVFPRLHTVTATVMSLNTSEGSFFVVKYDAKALKLLQQIEDRVGLVELDQLPDYGEPFAFYDCSNNSISRLIVYDSVEDGSYEAYLLDYGEYIRLTGNEPVYQLPEHLKSLPALAIKCYLVSHDIEYMSNFKYEEVKLLIQDNDGVNLKVVLVEDNPQPSAADPKNLAVENRSEQRTITCPSRPLTPEGYVSPFRISEEDRAMLNEIGPSTSDPLKAVHGFRPTDDQRICRHYDPKLNGCFKGPNCRLSHEPFAPHGATKDVQVAGALPETQFDLPVDFTPGLNFQMLITFIKSPIEVYAQHVDGSPPLVWDERDVPQDQRRFEQKPHILDIVLALYSDGCFYRSLIIEEMEGEYKIFYVDYGNTEFVPIAALAPCPDSERLKPFRAINCHIDGVIRCSVPDSVRDGECVEFLKSKLLNTELEVNVVSRLPDAFLIRLLGPYAGLSDQLVKRKYAELSDNAGGAKPVSDNTNP
ncbi:hypothetical protein KR018_012057, partial [Drosophila ironensis]